MFPPALSAAKVPSIMLSVIIPTLNADATLAHVIDVVQDGADVSDIGEIIIADGGSGYVPQFADKQIEVITGQPGRGVQLAAGAALATGDWLLFLHADTVPGKGWAQVVSHHMATSQQAAVFRFALDDDTASARRLEAIVRWRCKWLALPYGDQGLLISRRLYDEVGGFRSIPLMEDVDIVRRIGRPRLAYLDVCALTSAGKYVRDGYTRRMARNLFCLTLWSLGVSPQRIAGFYK